MGFKRLSRERKKYEIVISRRLKKSLLEKYDRIIKLHCVQSGG
jgi:hypothetical protein